MNWRKHVEQQNEKTYVLPEGWDSREKIAEELQCSPEKVSDHLRPSLSSGVIEKGVFKVWDGRLGRTTLVTAYRPVAADAPVAAPVEWTPEAIEQARALKKAGKSLAEIGAAIGKTRSAVKNKFERNNW